MTGLVSFGDYRTEAAREFAHTLIVVDDEAWQKVQGPPPRKGLRRPSRAVMTPAPAPAQEELALERHSLDAEALVNAAMELGLVCSIVRPPKNQSVRTKVGLAAKRADIVCLDWELHDDGGRSATNIIRDIALSDNKSGGRLRLIAIYTGDKNNNQILEKIFDALPKSYRERFHVNRDPVRIESNHGLRIVCLFKAHGIQLADIRKERQVREADLPARLQQEFALIVGGLMSNVALATIASIRDATHHMLSKMTASIDAPYFHHRAILPATQDAEEYSVNVVLSELKSIVDKRGVGEKYTGSSAIRARIVEIAENREPALRYKKGANEETYPLSVAEATCFVTDGAKVAYGQIDRNKPALKEFQRGISTLFSTDANTAKIAMKEFAALTGVIAHQGSELFRSGRKLPQLGLGSIVRLGREQYLLCLQATCDAVRLKKKTPFLFVPLVSDLDHPEHVIPILGRGGKVGYVGLSTPPRAYAEVASISFEPDRKQERVLAKKLLRKRGSFFVDTEKREYRWVADLKQRRALRTAQHLGQEMGRLGFDEFEPFRR